MNHLKGVASIFPPMIITISSVILMSGSQPRLPPGELSNMKPKSGNTDQIDETANKSQPHTSFCSHTPQKLPRTFPVGVTHSCSDSSQTMSECIQVMEDYELYFYPYAPMWMRWPWLSNMMFPLCLSLICSRKSTKL